MDNSNEFEEVISQNVSSTLIRPDIPFICSFNKVIWDANGIKTIVDIHAHCDFIDFYPMVNESPISVRFDAKHNKSFGKPIHELEEFRENYVEVYYPDEFVKRIHPDKIPTLTTEESNKILDQIMNFPSRGDYRDEEVQNIRYLVSGFDYYSKLKKKVLDISEDQIVSELIQEAKRAVRDVIGNRSVVKISHVDELDQSEQRNFNKIEVRHFIIDGPF